jgi:hypothetical protein
LNSNGLHSVIAQKIQIFKFEEVGEKLIMRNPITLTLPKYNYIKPRMRWAGHVARTGVKTRRCAKFWWENRKEKDQ